MWATISLLLFLVILNVVDNRSLNFLLFFIGVFGATNRHHRRQSNELIIKPEGPHVKAVGKNLFFTCKANVPNPKLVKDLKWYKPNGESIPEDDR